MEPIPTIRIPMGMASTTRMMYVRLFPGNPLSMVVPIQTLTETVLIPKTKLIMEPIPMIRILTMMVLQTVRNKTTEPIPTIPILMMMD